MPAPVRDIGFDEIYNPDNGNQNSQPSGGGGDSQPAGGNGPGGSGTGTGSNNDSNVTNTTNSNLFVFTINSNQKQFVSLVNGESVADNKSIRITRESLAKENKKIQIKKQGYFSDEYYLVEMVDDGAPIIKNQNFDQPLGINTKDIVLSYYKSGRLVGTPKSIRNTVSSELKFNLTNLKGRDEYEEPGKYRVTFSIGGSGKGSPVSILKNGNKNAEFFPKAGVSEYEDVDGTKYTIRSSDLTLYRITKIYFGNEELLANAGESLQFDVTLKDNYSFQIETEAIPQRASAKDPQIELVKDGAREYNINSKTGVPLMFRKNADVEAITVVIGDEVFEFDDLDRGNFCGVTIPHSAFKKIGKYNVKIFPFSFDDYENQVRPAEPADVVQTKPVTKKKVVKEEVVVEQPKVEDKYNKYKPKSGGGSGGGGGRPVFLDSGADLFDPTNPLTNDGSFVNRPSNNLNQL